MGVDGDCWDQKESKAAVIKLFFIYLTDNIINYINFIRIMVTQISDLERLAKHQSVIYFTLYFSQLSIVLSSPFYL